MNYTPENARKTHEDSKNQTRRVKKDGEVWQSDDFGITRVYDVHGRTKWVVGQSYAICPGRGKPSIGRRVLDSIRLEHLQDITPLDAYEEGIRSSAVKRLDMWFNDGADYRNAFAELWTSINGKTKGYRWEDNPEVWVLTWGAHA